MSDSTPADSGRKISWIPIEGDADVGQEEIRFDPARGMVLKASPDGVPPLSVISVPYATLASSKYFQRGRISFEVVLEDEKCRCQFILIAGLKTRIIVGFNVAAAAYGILLFRPPAQQGQGQPEWEAVATAKFNGHPPANKPLKARIEVFGSNISLSVNDVIVVLAQVKIQISRTQLALYLEGNAPISVKNLSIEAESPRAFIVMQFKEPYDTLYREVIRPVCEMFDYEAIRADDIYTGGLIIKEITQSIQEASIIIADITPNNPNVYYELGYAHRLNKPTILLSDKTQEKLPFDVSGFRTLFYENSIGGKRKVEELLKKHLQSVTGQYA
jgi:hypothetical protein